MRRRHLRWIRLHLPRCAMQVFASVTFGVNENTAANSTVGSPIVASDPDSGDTVSFTLISTAPLSNMFYLVMVADRIAQIMTSPSLPAALRCACLSCPHLALAFANGSAAAFLRSLCPCPPEGC